MSFYNVSPSYYSVSIATSGGAAPADGFVDSTAVTQYATLPTTLANSLAKERANMRFKMIALQLGIMANCRIDPGDITATGADANTGANPFVFTVFFERGDLVISTPDEVNAGQTLTAGNAVKRCVGRALSTTWSENRLTYDPTTSGNPAAARKPMSITKITAGALDTLANVEATITVTKVAGI